jgi:hypothetical protein
LRLPAASAFLVFVNGDIDLSPVLSGGGVAPVAGPGGPHGHP